MGGAIGFHTGRLLRLEESDSRTATMAGMAALFSALFGTPVAAAVFAMAVVSVGVIQYATLLPCLIASLTAYGVSLLLRVEPTRFALAAPGPDVWLFLKVGVLALLCACLSTALCLGVHAAEKQARKWLKSPWLRILAGGAGIVALSLLLGTDYNGAGMPVIRAAVEEGRAVPWAFAAKLALTALSLAAGFKGGEVVPSFFIGATFGCVVGPLLGIPAGFAAAVGLVAVFCGAVNCPLASTLLAVELFGAQALPYFALACALSYMFSGYTGLYSSQVFLYGKLKPWPLNIHANTERKLKNRKDEE
jgi:H+/Cl- antiporter ClcA